jgi:hypothetical protein
VRAALFIFFSRNFGIGRAIAEYGVICHLANIAPDEPRANLFYIFLEKSKLEE